VFVLIAAIAVVSIGADGGSLRLRAPAGPVSSHPPLSGSAVHAALDLLPGHWDARRLLARLARMYVQDPGEVMVAASLLQAARRSGRRDWLEGFVRAVTRRAPTAASLFLLAELQYSENGYAAGLGFAAAAHLALPDDPVIGISYAAGLASTGSVLDAYALVLPWTRDPSVWRQLPEVALRRLATLTGVIAPRGLGRIVTTEWLRRSWESQRSWSRSRPLTFASSLASLAEDETASVVLAAASLTQARSSSDPAGAALALMNATDVSTSTRRLVARGESVCQALPAEALAARADCLLSALQGFVGQGDLQPALRLYRLLRSPETASDLLSIRLATVAIPFLGILGEHHEAAILAEVAAAAAATVGDRQLAAGFLVRLAAARRFAGDYPGAHAAALRAQRATPGPARELFDRAAFEVSQATLAMADGGSGLADEAVATDWPFANEALATLAKYGPGSPQMILVAASRASLLEARGKSSEALREYLGAIDMFDSMRGAMEPDLTRAAALNDVWADMSRRALGLALARGEIGVGIDVLERSRARSADDRVDPSWFEALPRGTAVIVYVFGVERTWAIAFRDDRRQLIDLGVAPSSLRDRVILWRELAKSNAEVGHLAAIGEGLASSLLQPVEVTGVLDGAEVVYVIPDDVLHLMPFATLASSRSNDRQASYLLAQVPSIRSLVRALGTAPADGPLVAFGASGGAGTVAEMRAVRRAGGRVFTGPRATEAEWRRQSPRASAIHFGGHVAPPTPGATTGALVLRASTGFDGLLTIPEIVETDVEGSTIILLSCDTAARLSEPGPAAYYRQTPSLGDAFLAAGARAVVGNLWPITEADAEVLAIEFYKAGGPARGAAALEDARQVLRQRFPDLPRRWAGTVWLGAVSRDQGLGRRP